MKRINWPLVVDVLILVVLVAMFLHEPAAVNAQLGGSNGFQYTPVTTAANIQVKPATGQLHNITINGGTLTGTITVVDTSAANCSGGTTIGIIAANQVAGQAYSYDLQFNNGLCLTTAAAVNATVTWR